ncbi:hypothetical protein QU481_09440 [Crenobacter sp. SG2303]|uniref:HTTM domain-containing protein n=1 Tax=Crenobacter oryzisoli TaxID=3056844 RepID=A0ABT7XMV4_9NEIS|nr:hypothetical protein [Crenobacter sp. SG2303]MDN0075112.1 hypothetical protein [Crenobacter sp. SG2303]
MRSRAERNQLEVIKARRQELICRSARIRAGAKNGFEWHNPDDEAEHRRLTEELSHYCTAIKGRVFCGRETVWMANAMLAFSVYLFMAYRAVVGYFFSMRLGGWSYDFDDQSRIYTMLSGHLVVPVLENPVFLVWGATVLCYLSLAWKGLRGDCQIFAIILALIGYLHHLGY